MSRPIAIFAGYFVRYPLGGHVLAELHCLLGLADLGYRVIFVEESGSEWTPCYDPRTRTMTRDPSYGIGRLEAELRRHRRPLAWCYVDSERRYHGLDAAELRRLCGQAEFLFSRAAVTWLEEFAECRTRIFVDTDPGFTQFGMDDRPTPSCSGYASPSDFHHHFTFGTRIGQADCPIPTRGIRWMPTRPPILLALVPPRHADPSAPFTTVMNWTSGPPLRHDGVEYGHKDVEFERFLDLPRLAGPVFRLAVGGSRVPWEKLQQAGWATVDAQEVTSDTDAYRRFIRRSAGEFSVAKNLYVKTRCGWFSERTANYLAAGKPAIVQDTGFADDLPTGEGVFPFDNPDQVVSALRIVRDQYPAQCRAARLLAERWFDSRRVLSDLLARCGLPVPSTPS